MAKARRRRVRDTWKDKQWYKITTPKEFGESEIGTTPARDPNLLLSRKVEATMRELSGDFSKQYVKLRFQISDVAGDTAHTRFMGHQVTTDYVRSMIRRGTSRIDAIMKLETKDGKKLKVHMLAITIKRAKSSQQRYIRETMEKLVKETAANKTLNELVEDIIKGKLASSVYHETKKIYPLKRVETIKTRVIDEK
ncbi:30S ribosomal protein S3ae [Methanobacterium sp. CWC-01]|jgi:small subunit ribosomal protein S3Ae|uniref:30S ribosomal protein S3ae n=1 Tax=Methanobacterium aridiramus TaxID=2584467 RepID=UPI002577EA1D|nr:30S ribosomal protein S3ae [Methanobacterium sp. CWC-01]WJI09129.1 30S ribosomal protein S3ae [Methanobacterium sp. CWC-01]